MNSPNAKSRSPRLILRWLARIWSIPCIGLLALFFVGEGFDPGQVAPREWVGLLFFPVGVVAGMVLGWWKEGWGGAISLGSLLAFNIYDRLPGWANFFFAVPGLLFLTYWYASSRASKPAA